MAKQSIGSRHSAGSAAEAKAFIERARANVRQQVAQRRTAMQNGRTLKGAFDTVGTKHGGHGKGNPNHDKQGRFT